ncbi:MAG: DUF2202 domain-containing protein [Syntrophomonadaceae bacterium]|nr:DUF2202 domain-containing protein [Syntrophomonadaceae bacterium]
MRARMMTALVLVGLVAAAAGCASKQVEAPGGQPAATSQQEAAGTAPAVSAPYGAAAAAADQDLTLQDMLTYALQDEYLARSEYQVIVERYGEIRPFPNIILAEENHIEHVKALFTARGLQPPPDESGSHTFVPASQAAAYQAGVDVETANIALYERFLQQDLPEDVRQTFQYLHDGSQAHLQAFQRQLR